MNDLALLDLLDALDRADYDFVPVTPLTHRHVLANGGAANSSILRRLFGWSCVVDPALLPVGLADIMTAAGVIERSVLGVRSTLRVARLGSLFFHSAYPTDQVDAVFLGPDSYRFMRLIERELIECQSDAVIVDIGTGAGVGALTSSRLHPAAQVVGTDINPAALRLARINARYAGHKIDFIETTGLHALAGPIDVALINPPFLMDGGKRRYRDGGEMRGTGVALDMASAALTRLGAGGKLILYTGSPIVDGRDEFRLALGRVCAMHDATLRYEEIDPDIFGEELELAEYAGVERIALIGAVARLF